MPHSHDHHGHSHAGHAHGDRQVFWAVAVNVGIEGDRVEIRSEGYRHGPAEVMERLAAGEPVDPSRYYFRTALRFATASADPGLARLNGLIGFAVGARQAGRVLLDVYLLR